MIDMIYTEVVVSHILYVRPDPGEMIQFDFRIFFKMGGRKTISLDTVILYIKILKFFYKSSHETMSDFNGVSWFP